MIARTRTGEETAWAVALMACAALALRTPGVVGVVITAGVGLAALAVPERGGPSQPTLTPAAAGPAALGVAAFVIVRILAGSLLAPPASAWGAAATSLAAVSEEALFRRTLYARLERWGPGTAVFVSAALFGLVHVPAYSWGALPLDVAAGLVLGWQRAITGRWTVPAATHVVANLLQMR